MPLRPNPGARLQPRATGNRSAAYLAIAGGIGMCFMVLYTIVYLPLHHDFPVAFGESLQFGDLLALGSGALAVFLGVLALRQAPSNPVRTGTALMLAGVSTVVLLLLWSFPEALHLGSYPRPFYFGFVYFCELGGAHVGNGYESGYIQVPLLVCSLAVFVAGCLMAFARSRRAMGSPWQ